MSGRRVTTSKAQTRRTIVVNGPDPIGSAAWDGLAERTALELSPFGAPLSVRSGMTGSPEVTFYGDPGPLQIFPLNYGARKSFAGENANQALPATSSPTAGSTQLRAYLAEFQ